MPINVIRMIVGLVLSFSSTILIAQQKTAGIMQLQFGLGDRWQNRASLQLKITWGTCTKKGSA